MKKTISIIFFVVVSFFTFIYFEFNNVNVKVYAADLWQIEGTTVIAYNGSESTVNIPSGITRIGEGAFQNNTKINKVVLPESVKEIGMRAFASCTSLSEINLENVSKIGEVAFEGTVISEVVLSDELVEIPIGCFAYANVKTVYLGENVISIASSAFYTCRNLEEIYLSDNLYSIGYEAFYRCEKLTYINLPDSLMVIDGKAFADCGLLKVEIPSSVEELKSGTFSNCTSLSKIVFNEGLKKIGSSLIYESQVKELNIPSSVEDIALFAFHNATKLEKIDVDINNINYVSDNGILYTAGYDKAVLIPQNHPDKVISLHDGVTFGEEQFAANLNNVEKVIIPEGMVTLNHNAFTGCKVLEEVILPDSLEVILSGAFSYCPSLYEVILPQNLKELSTTDWWIGVFTGCTSLKEVVIPDSVEKIGPYTFTGCTSLERVVIPAGIIDYGTKQFSGCANLKEVIVKEGNQFAYTEDGVYFEIIDGVDTLALYPARKEGITYTVPGNVTSISSNAFDSVACLEEIIVPSTVTLLGEEVFSNTTSLKKVVLEASITSLPDFCFSFSSVEEVLLPSSLKEIKRGCFMNTLNLKTIDIPYGVTTLQDSCFYNSGIESIELPDSITEIGQAFFYAKKLKNIVLSKNITTFTASSFNNCAFEEITIPTAMLEIAMYSFVDCLELKKVYIPDTVANFYSQSFVNCPNLTELAISPTNKFFVEEDGILYNAEKTRIVFINKDKLSPVVILPDTLEEIGNNVFAGIKNIKEITIPSSVETIAYNAFDGCGIEKAVIGEGTKILHSFLFRNCTNLKEIILPESLETMEAAIFDGCTSLEEMIIPDGVNIDYAYSLFEDCVNLKYVKLPADATILPQYIFSGCVSLEIIEIPESVVKLETNFIGGCTNIKYLVLPKNITSIEYDAFINSGLEKLIMLGDAPILVSSVFGNTFFPSNLDIYVFKNSKGYGDKTYRPYSNQFSYISDDIFKDVTRVDVISLGEHNVLIDVDTVYADLYRYYIKDDEGNYQLLSETTSNNYLYEASIGNKTYDFKIEILIQQKENVYKSEFTNNVFVSKTNDEYLLDYLILEMKALLNKNDSSLNELEYVIKQYNNLNETYKLIVKEEVDVETLLTKYNELTAYYEDINKITSLSLSLEGGNKIEVGETTKLNVDFPIGIVNKDITYSVDMLGIVEISENGLILGLKEGTVKITVTALSGVSEEIEVTVNAITVEDSSFNHLYLIIPLVIATIGMSSLAFFVMKRGAKNE